MDTESKLIEACREIGNIADSSGQFTAGLSRRIRATEKEVYNLTVRELIELASVHRDFFNRVHSV